MDPKFHCPEAFRKVQSLIQFFCCQLFASGPDFRSSPFGLRCGFGYVLQLEKMMSHQQLEIS